jgi:hypothetical protein
MAWYLLPGSILSFPDISPSVQYHVSDYLNTRPVILSYAWMYWRDVASTTLDGSGGAGGSLFHPVSTSQSRSGCLS